MGNEAQDDFPRSVVVETHYKDISGPNKIVKGQLYTPVFSLSPSDGVAPSISFHTIVSFITEKLSECTPGGDGSRWRHLLILPLFMYLIIYASFPSIPDDRKLPINVSALVDTESIVFGGYLPHRVLNSVRNDYFDVLCAIPYTLHIPLPILYLSVAMVWERSLVLPYAHAFGIASLSGVIIQYVFPTAPPWYFEKYGEQPGNYSMKGDPAGLKRVDALFSSQFYQNMFDKSTIVFGSFPSLHVTWATLSCLFLLSFTKCCKGCAQGKFFKPPWQCPKWIPPMYVLWLSFAVVYLEHHYVLDVLCGLALAFLAKFLVIGSQWRMCGSRVDCTCRSRLQSISQRRQSSQWTKLGGEAPESIVISMPEGVQLDVFEIAHTCIDDHECVDKLT